MAHAPVFEGEVDEKGNLRVYDLDRFQRYLLNSLRGGRVRIVVSREKKVRSLDQNSYYHGVIVYRLAQALGYTEPEMHDALKYEFLRQEQGAVGTSGKPLVKIGSTAALSTVEFEELMQRIREWALAEFDIRLPLPNEVEEVA